MTQPRPKSFNFNDEMQKDFEYIKRQFSNKFGISPSNTSIMSLLLETYKTSKMEIKRKPQSKKQFLIKL